MDYQTKAIAYIDILGFKNYIEATKNDPKKDLLYKALFSFKDSEQSNPLKYPSRQASHFSDLLVITVDYERELVNQLINDLLQLTNSIINSTSLLLRGILIKGKILHYNGIIFGPGLIEAYEKEKGSVRYPRIIVDEKIIDELNLNNETLSMDLDNMCYIDYLRPNMDMSLDDSIYDFGFFNNKLLVEQIRLGMQSEDHRIKEKYEWIIARHNQIIEEYYREEKEEIENYYSENNQELEDIIKKKISI